MARNAGLGEFDDVLVAVLDRLIYEQSRVGIPRRDLVGRRCAAECSIKSAPCLPGMARQRAPSRHTDMRQEIAKCVHRRHRVHKDDKGSCIDGVGEIGARE